MTLACSPTTLLTIRLAPLHDLLTTLLPSPLLKPLCMTLSLILTMPLQFCFATLIFCLSQVPPTSCCLQPLVFKSRLQQATHVSLSPALPVTTCHHGCSALSRKGSPLVTSASNQVCDKMPCGTMPSPPSSMLLKTRGSFDFVSQVKPHLLLWHS